MDNTSLEDRAAVESQLGRPPRGDWRVARRCACGLPQVIETNPKLDDGTPFPTLYWLTCRTLASRVGSLETSWMADLNRAIQADEGMSEELRSSTKDYLARRDSLGFLPEREHPGGGPDRIKCLHAHVAHELVAGGNPAGRAALDKIEWEDPQVPCV